MTWTIDEKKIIYADLDPSEGVVLNLDTKYYYRLNETGQVIWKGLAEGKSAEAIVEEMVRAYDITPEAARADIDEILAQFKRERLATVTI